jgi:eukaryotic-like serine/threonine-protein kinase
MSDVDIEPGRIIAGKYRVEAALAQGGMGSVWRARHLALDTVLAIKFIGPNVTRMQEARRRFEREAKAAALLKSPHVVQIHDYGVEGDLPYLVMELLDGEDLGERLKRKGRLDVEEAVNVVHQVSRALRRAAEAGIVHRDLKPSNVFIVRCDEEELIKVLDFGIAKAPRLRSDDDRTRTGAVLGSPRYMSPEQARGNRLVDPRSDLWSLAVIAYRVLTGRLPFQGTDVADLLVKICSEDAPPPSEIEPSLSSEMDAFFVRALARNPDDRFQTARELASAFADAAGEPPPRTSRLPPVARLCDPFNVKAKAEDAPISRPFAEPPPGAPTADRATSPGSASLIERTTQPENRGEHVAPSPPADLDGGPPSEAPDAAPRPLAVSTADCEPTLQSEHTAAPRLPGRPFAESTTAREPTPHFPPAPPPLPPIPRRPFAESTTAPEPTPAPRRAPPPLPARPYAESTTAPEPTPAPPSSTPAGPSPTDPSMTPDATTSLHVVPMPESLPDRTLTPSGGSIDVSLRRDSPRRGVVLRLAIGVAIIVALGTALLVALWFRADATTSSADGSAPAPPEPVILRPRPGPTATAPEPAATSTAAPTAPAPTAAPPRRWPAPASKKKHAILGI